MSGQYNSCGLLLVIAQGIFVGLQVYPQKEERLQHFFLKRFLSSQENLFTHESFCVLYPYVNLLSHHLFIKIKDSAASIIYAVLDRAPSHSKLWNVYSSIPTVKFSSTRRKESFECSVKVCEEIKKT